MTDAIAAALIGVSGSVIVAVVALLSNRSSTTTMVEAQHALELARIAHEAAERIVEKRWDQIVDALAELNAVCDPQGAAPVDHSKAVPLIHRLDVRVPQQLQLARAVGQLGLAVQEYMTVQHEPIDDRTFETRAVLEAQSQVVELGRIVLHARERTGSALGPPNSIGEGDKR